MDGLTDGLRVRRARNATGTTWQDVRLYPTNYGQWSWGFGGGIYLNRMCFDGSCSNISATGSATAARARARAGTNSTDRRINTYPLQSAQLAERLLVRHERHAAARTTPPATSGSTRTRVSRSRSRRCSSGRGSSRPTSPTSLLPDSGAAAQTIRPMLDAQVGRPAVAGHRPQPGPDQSRARTSSAFAESGNTIFVGGKFRSGAARSGRPEGHAELPRRVRPEHRRVHPDRSHPVINGRCRTSTVTADGKLSSPASSRASTAWPPLASPRSNPTTGATIPGLVGEREPRHGRRRTCARIDIQGTWLYVGGTSRKITGGPAATPRADGSLGRVRVTDGVPDGTWRPTVDNDVWDIDANPAATASTSSARSGTLNGVTLPQPRHAIVDTTTGADGARICSRTSPTPTPSGADRSWRSATTSTRAARSTSCTCTPRATTPSSAAT